MMLTGLLTVALGYECCKLEAQAHCLHNCGAATALHGSSTSGTTGVWVCDKTYSNGSFAIKCCRLSKLPALLMQLLIASHHSDVVSQPLSAAQALQYMQVWPDSVSRLTNECSELDLLERLIC